MPILYIYILGIVFYEFVLSYSVRQSGFRKRTNVANTIFNDNIIIKFYFSKMISSKTHFEIHLYHILFELYMYSLQTDVFLLMRVINMNPLFTLLLCHRCRHAYQIKRFYFLLSHLL